MNLIRKADRRLLIVAAVAIPIRIVARVLSVVTVLEREPVIAPVKISIA